MKRVALHCITGLVAVTMAASILLQTGCRARRGTVSQTWVTMGTFATLVVPAANENSLPEYTEAVRSVFEELNADLTVYTTNSEVSVLNRAAGRRAVPVSTHTRDVLEESLRYARMTHGAFDPTLAPVIWLWGFSGGEAPTGVPETNVLRRTLDLCGYEGLVVTGLTARLKTEDAAVDLGGIAKGFAVDRAYGALVQLGAEDFMINLGGNIRCRGAAVPGGRHWSVGVRNPFRPDDLVGTIDLADGMALATSGNYERFVTIGDVRYAHIIDPRTGYPVRGMAGVTVISPSATQADAMSTALFVMGVDAGREALKGLPDCNALFVPDVQPPVLRATRGFAKIFTPASGFSAKVMP